MNIDEEVFNDFILNYLIERPWLIVILILVIILKGLALWQSSQKQQKIWFTALLVINSLGILEIFYLLYTRWKDNRDSGQEKIETSE